jgi:hypothetical protein
MVFTTAGVKVAALLTVPSDEAALVLPLISVATTL